MFNKQTLRDFELKGKKVLLRVDFNVPLNSNLQIRERLNLNFRSNQSQSACAN